MDRRNFLTGTAKIVLVTSGLFVTGNLLQACHNDDDGYYDGGYYDDRQKQRPKAQDLNQKSKTLQKP